MSRHSFAAALLFLAAGCATPEVAERPRPPTLTGERPAIGRLLDIDVRGGEGATIRLEGVKGRVTAVCVLGGEEAMDLAGSCADLADRWKDRIAVVGLGLDPDLDPREIPFRMYRDPGGRVISEILGLDPESQILLLDVQGRIARWFPPGRDEALDREVARLAW